VFSCWLRHLAQCALGSEARSFLVGRIKKSNSYKAHVVALSAVPRDEARALLDDLVAWYWRGQRIALPFLPAPSEVYARCVLAGKTPEEALDKAGGEYKTEPENGGGFDVHAVRAFDQRMPPFDPSFERGERGLDATLFHEVALSVHRPLFRAGGVLG
jgi:exonuclease V gamma subunit